MNCSGPCLPYCYCPNSVKILANLSICYIISSLLYLLFTRSVGTPFKDSLTLEQIELKKNSSKVRRNIFIKSLLLSIALIVCVRPINILQNRHIAKHNNKI